MDFLAVGGNKFGIIVMLEKKQVFPVGRIKIRWYYCVFPQNQWLKRSLDSLQRLHPVLQVPVDTVVSP